MPLYEYLCPDCQESFETLRPLDVRDDPAECPRCRRMTEQRKLSTFAAHGGREGVAVSSGPAACELPSCCGGSCSLN